MKGRIILFIGFFALSFSEIANAGWPGSCTATLYRYTTVTLTANSNINSAVTQNSSTGIITGSSSVLKTTGSTVYHVTYQPFYFENGSWHAVASFNQNLTGYNLLSGAIYSLETTVAAMTALQPSCEQPVCNTADDDSDGVCNSCDQLPNQPDKKHCIWNQSYTVDGRIGFMEIDQSGNCDGSSTVSRKNSQLDSETQYFDISNNHEEISAPTCAGDDGSGSCKCDYNSSVPSTLSPTTDTIDPKTQEELDKLPENSNCAEIKAACESACLKYGGTKTNTCTSSGESNHSSCACMDSTTINTKTKPKPETSSTGGETSSTGGPDSNSNGKDDIYEAVKDAIKDSGIGSKINSTNSLLNGIGNDINGILDSLKNGKTSGSAPLPDKNNYDDKVKDLEEQPLGDAIKDFMVSGLPLIDFIRGTGINNGSGESSLTFNVFGSDLELDFAPYSDLLEWVGLVLVFIASIIAFRIITNS
jgi:hypothetical protein